MVRRFPILEYIVLFFAMPIIIVSIIVHCLVKRTLKLLILGHFRLWDRYVRVSFVTSF